MDGALESGRVFSILLFVQLSGIDCLHYSVITVLYPLTGDFLSPDWGRYWPIAELWVTLLVPDYSCLILQNLLGINYSLLI